MSCDALTDNYYALPENCDAFPGVVTFDALPKNCDALPESYDALPVSGRALP